VTIARSRVLQLGTLTGAFAVSAGVYLFVGGLAGGLYAAAALVFGLFAHFKLMSTAEPAPRAAEPYWNRWGRSRAQFEDLEQALADERARAAEREAAVETMRRELEEYRHLALTVERRYLKELATQEKAHTAEADGIAAGLHELEEQLASFERVVDELARRVAPPRSADDSPLGGARFPGF
jgi:hypothetical protein